MDGLQNAAVQGIVQTNNLICADFQYKSDNLGFCVLNVYSDTRNHWN